MRPGIFVSRTREKLGRTLEPCYYVHISAMVICIIFIVLTLIAVKLSYSCIYLYHSPTDLKPYTICGRIYMQIN